MIVGVQLLCLHSNHCHVTPVGTNLLARLLQLLLITQLLASAAVVGWLANSLGWPVGSMGILTLLAMLFMLAVLQPIVLVGLATVYCAAVSRDPQQPWYLWLQSVVGEWRACLLVYVGRQAWASKHPGVLPATNTSAPAALGSGPGSLPVVLVHGFFCNHRLWDTLSHTLRARGHAVLALNLEPLFTSIDDYPAHIEAAVQTILSQTGQTQVAMVGHSMGGLAARAWLRDYGTERMAGLVTLGSPHAGTQIPHPFETPNGQEMTWHSDWLAKLAAQESPAVRSLMRIGLTLQDNIVYPQRDQVLPDVPVQVFEGIGHIQMCLDPAVITWVAGQLSDLQLADCKPH
jgi:triacylglycerol lipase